MLFGLYPFTECMSRVVILFWGHLLLVMGYFREHCHNCIRKCPLMYLFKSITIVNS